MLKNPIVDTNTTCAAKISIKYTTSVAKTLTKNTIHTVKHMIEHATKHAALRTSIKDLTSAARKLDISMIGAVLFNHLV